MIRHHLPVFEDKKQPKFEIDEKKLVKTFIYQNESQWIQYFTGFLFMEPNNQDKVDLKIRFSRHPHFAEIQAGIRYPLQLFTDNQGLYTLIHQQKIKTVQKPEQNLLYLKIGHEGRIIAISFHSKSYCKALLQHLTLVLENNESDEMTWTQQNLQFLNASMKQNLMYVDSVFILQERIQQFCTFFNKVDKKLYLEAQKNPNSQDEKYMVKFFEIIKNVFLREQVNILDSFEVLVMQFINFMKDNPFGVYHFNYFEEFSKMTVISNSVTEFQDAEFWSNYEMITKIRFLRDVAICTFIQIPVEAVFNDFLNKAYIQILTKLSNSKNNLIQKLHQLSRKDEYKYLCVFCEIWEIFKAVMEDAQTMTIKEAFYLKWIQNMMFSQTLSAIGRLVKNREVSDIHPRFWQKLMESMNPMLSYEWNETQKMILHHQETLNSQQTTDLMSSLVIVLANCDSNTKVLILDFVKVQIQVSQNRKHISAKYLSYVYSKFVNKSLQYCNNQQDIQKYIEFIQKIYVAEPIRTRHFIVESNFMAVLKSYFANKFIFIMLLKLLRTFIEVGDNDTFRYLSTTDFYDNLKEKYALNQGLANITNSLFLAIFKATEALSSKQGKKYLCRIFVEPETQKQNDQAKDRPIQEQKVQKTFKRSIPASGFQNQMDIQK